MAEAKARLPSFIGPSYTSRAERFDCQRTVNMYIELDELGVGKGEEPAVLISDPGLKFLQSIGAGPIRALYTLSNQQLSLVVSGNEVYQLAGPLAVPVRIDGNLVTETGPVSIADNGTDVILVDGQGGYTFPIGTFTLNTIVDPNFHPSDLVTFQDGYFICNETGSTNFFISDINSIDFPALNSASKNGYPDILIAAYSNNRQLYLLGAETLEIWYNEGASGSTPFVRQDGRFSQVGCASAASIARAGETFFWLGKNAQGGGVVYMLDGTMPKRISTHAVEFSIQQVTTLSQATGYAFQLEGHLFYHLNIPGLDTTWVYDVASGQWHEKQSTIDGTTGRHLAQVHTVLNNQHLAGDYRNGNLYQYDLDTYTDNGEMRIKLRQSPHVSNALQTIFYKLFELDCQFGVGLVNDGENEESNVNPMVSLQLSRDGGQTWGNAMNASIGKIGLYKTRARWQRLGKGRDIVFRVICTDNVRFTMLSAQLSIEVGFG